MSSQGPYSRYTAPSNNSYGQDPGSGGYGGGYGGGAGYNAGPAPGYGGASYAAPEYKAQGAGDWNQVRSSFYFEYQS